MTVERTEITDITTEVEVVLEGVLADLDFEVSFSGHKSSEGDGRTAADIERERDEEARTHGAE
jgi:hypothetical protein